MREIVEAMLYVLRAGCACAEVAARLFLTLARFVARDPWTWHLKPDH